MIESFSGAHPYRPQCVIAMLRRDRVRPERAIALAEKITGSIDAGRCPRCEDPLPRRPIWPAGSRVTDCRCVPVCGLCGDDETFHWVSPKQWPVAGVRERYEQRMAQCMPATPEQLRRFLDGEVVVKPRPHPGGWAEFGFDDTADTTEQTR